MEMIYPPNISLFVDKNKRQIVTNFSILQFSNQVNSLKHDGHISIFIIVILDSLM